MGNDGGERFAAYVAHELRTPLTTQRALLELALGDPRTDAVAWREIGEDVLDACVRQERIVEACLALARTRGAVRRRDPVDLAAIAAETLRVHDSNGLERVVALESAKTSGDPDLVERLVANLLSNATRHNVVGGWIELATHTRSGRAHLNVANTGPLLPTSRGLGLGLPIVHAIADAHDAAVTALTRPGGGLEIDVAFPALD
jgi:signal transduction histidine kinase